MLVNVLVGLVGAGVPVGASDPNWFYSTLAQSTAALVGLAGGFMVSRILQQRTEIANDRSVAKGEFESLWGQIAESRILAADVSQRARGVIVEVEPMLSSDHNAVSLDATRICSFSHPGNWGGSPGMEVTLEDRDLQALKELERAAEEFETVLPGRNDLSRRLRRGQSWPPPPGAEWLRGLAQAPVDNNFREALPQQRDYLRNCWQEWEEFYNRVSERLAGIRPRVAARTLYGLVAVLGGLLAAGLVWPLFYLSSRGGGSRDWALGLFIVLAGAFLLFLLNEVRRLQRSLDLERQWW